MESKRSHLIHKGLSEEATAFISDNLAVTRTRQRYEPAQQEFQQWLKDGSYEQGVNPAIVVVNWLCHVMAAKKLQWSSVLNRKAAILALFLQPEVVTADPVFQSFLKAGHSLGFVDTKHEIYSIDPVLTFFRSSPNNQALPLTELAKKLTEQVVSTTISVYMNTISRLFVPKGTRPLKLRALGSTLAAMAGVPIPDIMVQGNWSSSKIFEKHYRLSSVISNNLSVSTLGIPLESHMDMAP